MGYNCSTITNKLKQNDIIYKRIINMNTEEFECYLINILDSEELTNEEKITLIRQYI